MNVKRVEVKRWEFEGMSGSFELRKAGWVRVVAPIGEVSIIHKDQIITMAKTLAKENNPK